MSGLVEEETEKSSPGSLSEFNVFFCVLFLKKLAFGKKRGEFACTSRFVPILGKTRLLP